jgi:apolipoprotein N-acyltransferase
LRAGPALLAFGAGAAVVASFGDWPLFPFAIAALAIPFWLWTRAPSPSAAAWIGFAFGAGFFLAGVSWVYVSLHTFGGMPGVLAGIATLLFCLYLALFPATVGYMQAKLTVPRPLRLMLVMPALWALAEWVRAWLFTGFPWLALGYSQLDGPLDGYAPLSGVFGVSFIAAMAAGGIVTAIVERGRARFAAFGAVAVIVVAGLALRTIAWTTPHGAPLAVSLLQGNVPQELKFVEGRYAATLAAYARLAEGSHARLTVFPEIAIPRFLHQVDPAYLARLANQAAARDGDMLIGVPEIKEDGRYYNSIVSLGASPRQSYAKSHLVPFGEFAPPGFGWVIAMLKIPLGNFSRGAENQKPLAVAGQRVAINICYEDAFGAEIIRPLPEATLLVNVSNVAWFGDSLAPEQHLRIARMRAVETGRYMLRATNTGVTAIIESNGKVAGRLPAFTEGALQGTVQGRAGATPYVAFGDWPVVFACFAIVAAALAWGGRARTAVGAKSRVNA